MSILQTLGLKLEHCYAGLYYSVWFDGSFQREYDDKRLSTLLSVPEPCPEKVAECRAMAQIGVDELATDPIEHPERIINLGDMVQHLEEIAYRSEPLINTETGYHFKSGGNFGKIGIKLERVYSCETGEMWFEGSVYQDYDLIDCARFYLKNQAHTEPRMKKMLADGIAKHNWTNEVTIEYESYSSLSDSLEPNRFTFETQHKKITTLTELKDELRKAEEAIRMTVKILRSQKGGIE